MDLDRKLASIRQEVVPLTKPGGVGREGVILPRTKARKARIIELDSDTVKAIKSWCTRQKGERLAIGDGYRDNDPVFCRPDGRPYHPESFSKTFEEGSLTVSSWA